jgi:hypothetical protein
MLSVLTKWEDLAGYAYIAIKGYPKSEKHTLAARTIDALLETGAAIQRAGLIASQEEKRFLIHEADRNLARFKLLVRLGVKLGFMPLKKSEVLGRYTSEVGKMLGGWSKSSLQR